MDPTEPNASTPPATTPPIGATPPPESSSAPSTIPPSSTDASPSKRRNKRGPTTCKDVVKVRLSGSKVPIVVDSSGRAEYPSDKYQSYLGTLARTRVDIRLHDWRKVPKSVKELIWADVQVFS